MQACQLFPDSTLPLMVRAERPAAATPDALAAWAGANRAVLDGWLHAAGAVLFRGFALESAEDFRRVSSAVRPALMTYVGGDSPRSRVAEQVYTSTEFPAHLEIALHNELSYAGRWPERLFFFCRVAAEKGGETQIADGRRVLARLEPGLRRKFAEKGVTYIQQLRDGNGPPGPGKSWQETFETNDPAAAEAHCRDAAMDFQWTGQGLRTVLQRPGVLTHPVTGETAWFNQADHWHAAAGGAKHPDPADAEAPEDEVPCHARFGDGSAIAAQEIAAVQAAARACEVCFPWQAGDLLVLDNRLAMHGRKPFQGARQVLVAMA